MLCVSVCAWGRCVYREAVLRCLCVRGVVVFIGRGSCRACICVRVYVKGHFMHLRVGVLQSLYVGDIKDHCVSGGVVAKCTLC